MYNFIFSVFDFLLDIPYAFINYFYENLNIALFDYDIQLGFGEVVWFSFTLDVFIQFIWFSFIFVILIILFIRIIKWLFSIPKKLGGRL